MHERDLCLSVLRLLVHTSSGHSSREPLQGGREGGEGREEEGGREGGREREGGEEGGRREGAREGGEEGGRGGGREEGGGREGGRKGEGGKACSKSAIKVPSHAVVRLHSTFQFRAKSCGMETGNETISPTHLWVSMLLDVHLSEGADVPNSRDLNGEVPEKVNDVGGLVPQVEEEDEGGDQWAEEFVNHVHLEGGREGEGGRERGGEGGREEAEIAV